MFARLMTQGSPAIAMGLFCTAVLAADTNATSQEGQSGEPPVSFQRDVRPLLTDRCFVCHGPDPAVRKAGLRLDARDAATVELDSGAVAIVPGDVEASELVRRISSLDSSERMPPTESEKSLSAEEIALLTRWIEQGAKYEQHWAFGPVSQPELPSVRNEQWVRNPIDRFTLARMEAAGLAPSPEAPPEKLARRIYFDVIGLPPSPEELAAFKNDTSPDALRRLVDRLFASPHYGERMAIDWLDAARYADSNGYQNDFARQMWPWRDWVIRAFNDNMPFDQFTVEQLAGDLLPDPTRDQVVATGFNRNNRTVTEAGSLPEEWLVENAVDRVETTGTVFLGLTMGCSRCHDHKYDPISQKEFYEFFSFFNNITEKGVYVEQRGNVPPLVRIPTAEQRSRLAALEEKTETLRRTIDLTGPGGAAQRDAWREALPRGNSPTPGVHIALEGNAVATRHDGRRVTPKASDRLEWFDGFPGAAAHLHGRGIEYGEVFAPRQESPYAMAAWVRPIEPGAILSKMDSAANHRGVDLTLHDDMRLSAHLVHYWPGNAIKVVTRKELPKEEWSHVAVTYDGSSTAAGVKLYVNGVAVDVQVEIDNLAGTLETQQPFRIGQRSSEYYFEGEVTGVQLFDVALTPQEVRQVAAQRVATALGDRFEVLSERARNELVAYCTEHISSDGSTAFKSTLDRLGALEQEKRDFRQKIPTVMVMEERSSRHPTYVLKRGAYDAPDLDQPVQPDVPDFLPPLPAGDHNRLTLANWIVDSANPLTARVTVNRLWARYFQEGIVKTTENFGLQAEFPSHLELLDWLAAEFVSSGWDLQHIQRLIITSATYRQSSACSAELRAKDPENHLLARGPRERLPAELIRDNALVVSGLLVRDIGGPSVMPYQPEGLWEELAGGAHEEYVQDTGENLYRRSLYIYRKRTVPHPALNTFDAPSWEICQVKRETTNTPLQALALLNDVTYVEAARKLAERMFQEGGDAPASRLAFAFRVATGRFPSDSESNRLLDALKAYEKVFADDVEAARDFLAHGDSPQSVTAKPQELAAYTAAASVILNLDETMSKD